MKKVCNIIFDLGGVILNLDFGAIEKHFQNLLGKDYFLLFRNLQTQNIFDKFEVGEFSEEEFLHFFMANGKITQQQALDCWNSILLDVPAHRLEFIRALQTDYNVYLLSNTNFTHVQKIEADLLQKHGVRNFREEFFKIGYYSFEIGMRKPEKRIFQYVLDDAGLNAEETLFIDDNKNNINSATAVGMQTILHAPNSDMVAVLKSYLGIID